MKSEIERLLAPGELSIDGFLGSDTRSIDQIITQDKALMLELDLSFAAVASRLEALKEAGKDILERERELEGRYMVKVRDDRGPMPNPAGGKPLRKGDITLKDSKTGKSIRYNDLTIMMLRDFGFCSGNGSDYRLDPAELKAILY